VLGEWSWANLAWTIVGRLLLGLSFSSLVTDWVLGVEVCISFYIFERKIVVPLICGGSLKVRIIEKMRKAV
jgi:hypothetical protein